MIMSQKIQERVAMTQVSFFFFAYLYFSKGEELALPIIPEAEKHIQSWDSYCLWLVLYANKVDYYPEIKQNALNLWIVVLAIFQYFEGGRRQH